MKHKRILAAIAFVFFVTMPVSAAQVWVPLAIVPENGKTALGQFLPATGETMPSAETTATLSRKDAALVLEAVCREPNMDKVVAKGKTRDENRVWQDDCIGLLIQPKGEEHYAHIVVNSLGTLYDEFGRSASWNGEGISATCSRGEDSWSVTVVVPFAAFGGVPENGDEWRINVYRSRVVVHEVSGWSPPGDSVHNPSAFGVVRFSSEPYPVEYSWRMTAPGTGRIHLAWSSGADVKTTLGGRELPSDGAFAYNTARNNRLCLEGHSRGTCVFRTMVTIPANPYKALLRDVTANLDGIDTPAATVLKSEMDALGDLLRDIPPGQLAPFRRTFARLASKARDIRVCAEFTAAGHSKGEIPYGVETSLVKLLKHGSFNGEVGGTVRLDAARNEMDAAQIVMFADDATRHLVELKVDGDMKSDDGKVLLASALRLRRVGYVKTVKPDYQTEHVGLWPDPLIPSVPFDIAADSFETVWIDVRVPEGQAPSLYRGSVTATALNGEPTRIPVEVRVRNFTIPRKSSITSAFGLGSLNPAWKGPQDKDAYVDNMLEHRVSPDSETTPPKLISLPMWDWMKAKVLSVSVRPDRDAELQATVKLEGGKTLALPVHAISAGKSTVVDFGKELIATNRILSVKFTVANTEVAELGAVVRFEDGTRREVATPSVRRAGIAEGWIKNWPTWQCEAWVEPDVPAVFDWSAFDAEMEKLLAKGITSRRAILKLPLPVWSDGFQRHLSEKGWLEYFFTYIFDEPEPKKYGHVNSWLSQVKLAKPGVLRNMLTARSFPPELPFVDIWCPEIYTFKPDLAAVEKEKGREVWWYVAFSSRHPYPNVWIDYPALDCRIWPWLTWKHDLDGILYWHITYWRRKNPWETAEVFPRSNGDGSLVYPGLDGKPVDSIRWECIRDGMEDYEVFCLLEAAARELEGTQPSLVADIRRLCAIDDSVAAAFNNYNPDPRALLDARRQMSECLEKAVAALGREPVISGRPRHRPGLTQDEVQAAHAKIVAGGSKLSSAAPENQETPTPQPADRLRLYYRFDTELPYIFDYSGNGMIALPGVPSNVRRIPGEDGMALQLVKNGYVTLPSGNALLGSQPEEGTIEFIVRPDFDPATLAKAGTDKYACLFYLMEKDGNALPDGLDEIGLYIRNDRLLLRLGGRGVSVGSISNPFRQGQWHRVAIVWKPGVRSLFIDGKPLIRNTSPYTPPRLDGFHGTLGAHSPHHAFPFNGTFDNLKVWSRALREDELSCDFNGARRK